MQWVLPCGISVASVQIGFLESTLYIYIYIYIHFNWPRTCCNSHRRYGWSMSSCILVAVCFVNGIWGQTQLHVSFPQPLWFAQVYIDTWMKFDYRRRTECVRSHRYAVLSQTCSQLSLFNLNKLDMLNPLLRLAFQSFWMSLGSFRIIRAPIAIWRPSRNFVKLDWQVFVWGGCLSSWCLRTASYFPIQLEQVCHEHETEGITQALRSPTDLPCDGN